MASILDIRDLYMLKYQAVEEGVSLRDYLHRQKIHGIDLDTSIDNASGGLSTSEFLKRRRKKEGNRNLFERLASFAFTVTLVGSLISTLFYVSPEDIEKMKKPIGQYETWEGYYKDHWRSMILR